MQLLQRKGLCLSFIQAFPLQGRVSKYFMPTLRVVTGSYEHNLLCVALTFGGKSEVFTPVFHFAPHTQSIRCLAWSKRILASGANDEWIRLYDLQHRKELGTLMHQQGQILTLEFFGSKWLFSGAGDGKIVLWRTSDWEILAELKAHKAPVLDTSVHHTGKIMLSIGEDRKLVLWNLMTARKASIRKLGEAPVQVSFVPPTNESRSDYIIGYDRKVVLYTANGKASSEWAFPSRIHKCGWATIKEELYLIVSTDNGKLSFIHPSSSDIAFELQGHATRVKDFSVWQHYLASVSTDGNIVVWDLDTREQLGVYNAGDRLNCVALIPDELEKLRPKRELEAEPEEEAESEPEEVVAPPPKKKKKAKVLVTREK